MMIKYGRAGVMLMAAMMLSGSIPLNFAGAETIHMKDGNLVRAEIIARKADRIIVDLGFTVLSIPSDSIERIVELNEEGAAEPVQAAGRLWSVEPKRAEMTIKQNVVRCGEAVVQVRTGTGLGSGFVIHKDGYLITNDHVIAGEHQISITVFQQTDSGLVKQQYNKIRIVATSSHHDLALLKIETDEPREFVTVPLGDSDDLRQGQTAFAIGSPLGLERSVSQGIISLKNRELEGNLYIQTTAQINPGNSGGPLFNLNGEVIGVTNMKISAAGTEGLGFAIPANVVKMFVTNRDAFAYDARNPNAGF